MNRIALAVLVGAAMSVTAAASQAQQADRRPDTTRTDRRNRRMDREPGRALMRGIDLTDAQRERLKQIRESYRPQHLELRKSMKALHEKGERPDSATMLRFKELAQRQQAEIRTALTPEQRTTFDANMKALRDRPAKHRRG